MIKEPKNQREIQQARDKRIRHKLHTEAETDVNIVSQSAEQFFAWVAAVLNNSATFARFRQLCRPPYATNELVEGIFTSFEKIFESQNSFEKFEFSSPELEQDFADYRKRIGDFNFWETQGMEAFKNSIDNILIVDLPALLRDPEGNLFQESDRPEPYYYLLDVNRLIDIENHKMIARDPVYEKVTGEQFYFFKTEYVIFRDPNNAKIVYVFDDVHYRVVEVDDNQAARLISEVPHDLGYCPARSLWTTPLNSSSKLLKRGPITNSLSDLDWLLFFQVAERYLQLYAPFPIYAMYRNKCTYKENVDGGTGRSCVDGYLEIPGQRYYGADRTECPKCKQAGRVGPGHVIFIDPPREVGGTGADPDLMANPIKIIPAETNSLEYIQNRIAALKNEITINCIGRSKDTNDASAKNEMQVESGFQTSEAILLRAKRNFETVHEFALDTVCRLRYGEAYLGGTINYGDEFFVKSEDQETDDYTKAKDSGAPAYELIERRRDIYKARYRNDPKRQKRLEILEHLEPFPDIALKDLVDMSKSFPDLISQIDVIIKMHFNEFINRFERERAPLTTFGSAIDFSRKINLIREDLAAYAQGYLEGVEAESEKEEGAGDPPPNPNPVPPIPAPSA